MKIFRIIYLSFLFSTLIMAFTSKVKEPVFVTGTSEGKYKKPGAPVDIKYRSEHVEIDEISKVDITVISNTNLGTMNVKIKLDKQLNQVSNLDKRLFFELDSNTKEYPIHLEVSAEEDGLYYIKLLISIKGKGMRAFVVPVYVGNGLLKTDKASITKTEEGENINVLNAQEIIIEE